MRHKIQTKPMMLGEGLPKICIPLTDTDVQQLKLSAQTLLNHPCDFVEWRADFYTGFRDERKRSDTLTMLREILGDLPILFTIRTKEEGGLADISTGEYESILHSVINSRLADLVDVELMKGDDVMVRLCTAAHRSVAANPGDPLSGSCVTIVGSRHDFEKTPEEAEIVESLCKMRSLGADIAKFAVMPTCERDVLTLLSATLTMKEHHPEIPVITMSMGHLGALSRISGTLTGSAVTFGTAGNASAPGQLPADILKTFLESLA